MQMTLTTFIKNAAKNINSIFVATALAEMYSAVLTCLIGMFNAPFIGLSIK
jgi:hypothetical protein